MRAGSEMATPSATRLVVTRREDRDIRQRQVFLSLDGQPLGDLLFGEEVSKEIAPGPHTLKANNTVVWKTVKFEAAPGEEVRFSAVNYSGRGFWMLIAFAGIAPMYLAIERQ
jgi:hypothetical protein